MEFNILAILSATVASMVIGTVWFSDAVFGKAWKRLAGIDPSVTDQKAMIRGMIIGFLGSFATSTVLWILLFMTAIFTVSEALTLAFLVWIGFSAPVYVGSVAWEGKPWALFVLQGSYQLTALLAISAILVFFR